MEQTLFKPMLRAFTRSSTSDALIEQHPGLIYEVELPRNNDSMGVDENLKGQAAWCYENIGPMGKFWDLKLQNIDQYMNTFIFLNEDDAMGFKLAWCE